ncbi:unnamed protein product [Amaranthus hypochondriacus]
MKEEKQWKFKFNGSQTQNLSTASNLTINGVLDKLMKNVDPDDPREVLLFGQADPSIFPSFITSPSAEDAIIHAFRSRHFNSYSSSLGIPPARKAVAEYLSVNLPYKLTPDDVFITIGGTHAIEVALSSLVHPEANILLPKPGYPHYEAISHYLGLETRHFDLLPHKGWEIDLHKVLALADQNTVAMVIINPGNPCGCVYTYNQLQKVAEIAKKLGILVIADEVYEHLNFGSKPFVPMGVFGDVVPVITLGSLSKRWVVPGWRIGWLVINDTQHILNKSGLVDNIKAFLNISNNPATFIQGALPQILKNTKQDFFSSIVNILRQDADICYNKLQEIPSITCPNRPEGSMFVFVKLNLSLLHDIKDDLDFCIKLSKEEKMIVLPGAALGMKNWLRIMFALEPSILVQGLERLQTFCLRHAI